MTPKQKRTEIKRLLNLLEPSNRIFFAKMYAPSGTLTTIEEVVDNMPAKQLSWALTQCSNSYNKLFKVIKSA